MLSVWFGQNLDAHVGRLFQCYSIFYVPYPSWLANYSSIPSSPFSSPSHSYLHESLPWQCWAFSLWLFGSPANHQDSITGGVPSVICLRVDSNCTCGTGHNHKYVAAILWPVAANQLGINICLLIEVITDNFQAADLRIGMVDIAHLQKS